MLRWGKRDSVQSGAPEKWTPLAPSAPAGSTSSFGGGGGLGSGSRFASVLKPSKPAAHGEHMVGRWPEGVLLRIVSYLPIPDLPAVARVNRSFARIVRAERGWEARCNFLRITPQPAGTGAAGPPKPLELKSDNKVPTPTKSPLKPRKDSIDDDFGDFSTQNDVFEEVDFGDMAGMRGNGGATGVGGVGKENCAWGSTSGTMETNLLDFGDLPMPNKPTGSGGSKARTTGFFALVPPTSSAPSSDSGGPGPAGARNGSTGMALSARSSPLGSTVPGPFYTAYKAHHLALIPLCRHLRTSPSPSSTLTLLFPPDPRTSLPLPLSAQADRLLTLLLFLSPRLQPLHDWGFLRQALLAAADRFDSSCLVAFEVADTRADEAGMEAAAKASWTVWEAGGGSRDQWECGRVWVEKREVFYETGKWDPMENIVKVPTKTGQMVRQLDFTPMDAFMAHVVETFRADAELAVRIFPAQSKVVLSFCDRVASDVIGEYITSLLSSARAISPKLYLQATPASFVQAWKLVDVATSVLDLKKTKPSLITPSKASPRPSVQSSTTKEQIEDTIFRMFEPNMDEYLDEETEAIKHTLEEVCRGWDAQLGEDTSKAHSSSPNAPTFLTSSNPDQVKRNVLAGFKDVLLLPVTIVPRTVTFGVNAIVAGGNTAVNGLSMLNPQKWGGQGGARMVKQDEGEGADVLFDIPTIDVEDEKDKDKAAGAEVAEQTKRQSTGAGSTTTLQVPSSTTASNVSEKPMTISRVSSALDLNDEKSFDRLQLLVSLDTALELIQADRDSLKRCETFAKYPAKCGQRVREAIEEIFVLLLKSAGDRHIAPGFRLATNQMSTYKPDEHAETTSVAPLLQFFELVHIGDTIQSMVQVYFDKELTAYIDKTDFLNTVMREKKRFEGILDDAVAGGLNAGIEVLMNQVEHIIVVKTGPREYYPVDGAPLDLGPTTGCQEAIKCLEMHCNLLRGSTSKEVLEVFYQEVGIRLQQILQRHLKRQIISLEGGFQIIADLNAYHTFVASLKQQRITEDFSNLKMLGHVYIVSDARDLAQIVRDVTRYGGTFRPEDIYEFIQRRADWKKIEKTVDKAMYALSVKDDCVIM